MNASIDTDTPASAASQDSAASGRRRPQRELSLAEVVDRISTAGEGEHVSVDDVMAGFGPRAFGPMILAPALIVASPLSGIPGLASVAAVIIALISGQLILGRPSPWLPRFLRRQCVSRSLLERAAGFLKKGARWIDRVVGPRLEWLTMGVFARVIAAICLLVAVAMPPLEILPLVNSISATVIAVFSLSLVAHDGLLALIATALTVAVAITAGVMLTA